MRDETGQPDLAAISLVALVAIFTAFLVWKWLCA